MLDFKIIKMDRVFEVIYKAMSYSVISQISYEILFMFLLKLNKYIYIYTMHSSYQCHFKVGYIIYKVCKMESDCYTTPTFCSVSYF